MAICLPFWMTDQSTVIPNHSVLYISRQHALHLKHVQVLERHTILPSQQGKLGQPFHLTSWHPCWTTMLPLACVPLALNSAQSFSRGWEMLMPVWHLPPCARHQVLQRPFTGHDLATEDGSTQGRRPQTRLWMAFQKRPLCHQLFERLGLTEKEAQIIKQGMFKACNPTVTGRWAVVWHSEQWVTETVRQARVHWDYLGMPLPAVIT